MMSVADEKAGEAVITISVADEKAGEAVTTMSVADEKAGEAVIPIDVALSVPKISPHRRAVLTRPPSPPAIDAPRRIVP